MGLRDVGQRIKCARIVSGIGKGSGFIEIGLLERVNLGVSFECKHFFIWSTSIFLSFLNGFFLPDTKLNF